MKNRMFQDSTGKTCAAKTWFSIAAAIILFKFAASGISLGGFTFGEFDAGGASMLLSAFGAVYWGRNHTKANSPEKGAYNVSEH